MSDVSGSLLDRRQPEHGRRVRPTNAFIEFEKEEIEQSISQRFERQVTRYPDRLAVKTGSHQLTYAALDRAANRVARAVLARRGEGAEPIGLLLGPGVPLIVAILGVLKTGKFYVPLDSWHPHARNLSILEDSQAKLIVTDGTDLETAIALSREQEVQVLNVEAIDSGVSSDHPGLDVSPSSLAYVLYTSGSTGRPKGVVHNHRNVLHCALRLTNGLHLVAYDRLSLLSSFSFSGAVLEPSGRCSTARLCIL